MVDSTRRSLVKALSWRVIATVITTLLVFVYTGRLEVAALIGGLDAVIKLATYFLHERLWNRISFGRQPDPGTKSPNYQI